MAEAFKWSRDFIAIWLPVSQGEQLYHALLRKANCRTYAQTAPAESQVEALARATVPADFMAMPPGMGEALGRWGLDTPSV